MSSGLSALPAIPFPKGMMLEEGKGVHDVETSLKNTIFPTLGKIKVNCAGSCHRGKPVSLRGSNHIRIEAVH